MQLQNDENCIKKPVTILKPEVLLNTYWSKYRQAEPSHVFLHEHEMSFDVINVNFD